MRLLSGVMKYEMGSWRYMECDYVNKNVTLLKVVGCAQVII